MECNLENTGRLLINGDTFLIPEIQEMVGFDQKSSHHPEGKLIKHVMQVLAYVKEEQPENLDLHIAAIFHDIAKPVCWQVHKDNPEQRTFYGHETEGAKMFQNIDARYGLSAKYNLNAEKIVWLIRNHIKISALPLMKNKNKIKFQTHEYFEDLQILNNGDMKGKSV